MTALVIYILFSILSANGAFIVPQIICKLKQAFIFINIKILLVKFSSKKDIEESIMTM